jgi:hypothetical protein
MTMLIRYLSILSLLTLIGVAVCLIIGKSQLADHFGILTFCLYAVLVIVTVVQWFSSKEK